MTDGHSTGPRESEGRTLPRQTQLALLGVAAVVALFLFFGVPWLGALLTPKPPPPPAPPPAGTFVATDEQWATLKFYTVSNQGFQSEDETDGKIATDDDHTTQVFSPFSGRVTQVFAKAGDTVKAGQPLFAVQATEFVQAQSDLVAAEAQLKIATAADERQHELFKASGAALKDVQQADADLANAKAALAAVHGRLDVLGMDEAQIAALEHGDGAKGAETIVRAPIGGVVTQRAIGIGQNIGSVTNGGANPAFVVSDISKLWLVGNLREDDAPQAHVGETAEVRVEALPDRVFTAKINFVSPTVDPVTRRVAVRGEIANPGGVLKPEMFANFTLVTSEATSAVGVPEAAVIYEGDTARVWIAHDGRALELRQIKAGRTENGMVEVISGLQPGERVVTSGSLFIDRAAQGA
jgi:cobalt-zinc-cadmium efflux system membrane fusion protein